MESFAMYAGIAYGVGAVLAFGGTCFAVGAGKIDSRGLDVPLLAFMALGNAVFWPIMALAATAAYIGVMCSKD